VKPEFASIPVLIADDMPAVRSIIREMLEGMGFKQIEEAEDGEQAWEMIQGGSYGLLLTDWLMPGLEGVDLVREIRTLEKTRDLPVLMITSQGQREQWAEAKSAGVTGFVVKPFDLAQLSEELRRCLAR
jgi:two-component system chemotaxis response regulator CheY